MRRFRTITLALCAMALAMGGTSCKKEKENNVQSGDRMVIGANIEQGGSKTQIGPESDNQFPVLWSADDSFTLYAKENMTGSTFTIQEGGAGNTSAQFEGEKPEGNAPYLAMYPTSGQYNGNKVFTYYIPAIQNSETIEHAGPMVGYSADGKNVSFQNAASWIRIGLKGTAKVAKVVLTYKTSSKPMANPLSGRLQITVKDDGTIGDTEIAQIEPGKDDVPTLTLEKTAELGDDDYTYFGFLVPERAFGAPAVFTVLDANGKTLATIEKSIPSVERGKVYVSVYGTAIAPAPTAPAGALPGLFTVNESGKQVYFSQGNLQFHTTNKIWRFAEHQYDICDNTTEQHATSDYAENTNKWIDLFGWGTSGYHQESDGYNTNYQPWATSKSLVDEEYNQYGYGPSKNVTPEGPAGMTQSAGNISGSYYDWGVNNAISNGGNQAGKWRTLTDSEWIYLIGTRKVNGATNTYVWATVDGVGGLIIFHDDYKGATSGLTSIPDGCVFLPAAGNRYVTEVKKVGSYGDYWTSSYINSWNANSLQFTSGGGLQWSAPANRYCGLSVRLVTENKKMPVER